MLISTTPPQKKDHEARSRSHSQEALINETSKAISFPLTVVIANHLGFDYGFAGKENSPSRPFRAPYAIKYVHTEDNLADCPNSLLEDRTNCTAPNRKVAACKCKCKSK
jgi:hypothetical protein